MPLEVFPIVDTPGASIHFVDDFGAYRRGPPPHTHQGTDVWATKGTPVVAVEAGAVHKSDGGLGGLGQNLITSDGSRYYYAHLSALEGADGRHVETGDVIGYVGNSGNASNGAPHLHFEVHPQGGAAVDPYPMLIAAPRITAIGESQSTWGGAQWLQFALGVGTAIGGFYLAKRYADRSKPHAVAENPISKPALAALAVGAGALATGVAVLATRKTGRCLEQPPQSFLIRQNYIHDAAAHKEAIRYRTEHYGYVQGFGDPSWNKHPPSFYAVQTKFMGLSVTVNRKIVPALQCVEAAIKKECGSSYVPRTLSGLRTSNTFRGGEVSNHLYGIAIDIDPDLNPCCGCVPPWSNNQLCKKASATEYDRMSMPECWVHVFERYGFYWLGHDPDLRDTMHFEWLGVPSDV